jgi:hypothetical protein
VNLSGGDHTFSVTATDAAGNASAPALFDWSVDVGVPDPPTITDAPEGIGSTEASFSFDHPGNVRFGCSLDGGGFEDCTSPKEYTNLSEGAHDFSVVAINSAGLSDPVSVSWEVVDTTPPSAPTFTEAPDGSSGTDVAFAFTHDEAGVTFSCSLDDAEFAPCTSPVTATLTGGPHSFEVVATDTEGNPSAPALHGWIVDTAPPDPPSFTDTPGAVSDDSVSFSFSGEPGATFECALDDADYAPCVSPKNHTALEVGEHTFAVRAIDLVGNVGAASSHTWEVAALTPVDPPIITGFPQDPSRASATFEFRHTEVGTTFRCAIDDGPFNGCSSPATFTGLAEGERTFSVVAENGGRTSDPAGFTWTVDLTPPAVPALTFTSLAPNNATVRLDFSSDEPDATFECRLDTAPFAPCATPVALEGLATGNHAFEAVAIDRAGNRSAVARRTWIVDNTAPVVTLNGNADALVTNIITGAAWSGSDDSGIVRYELVRRIGTTGIQEQVALPSPTATNFSFNGQPGATYCFQVRAYDGVGNVGASPERCRAVPFDDRSTAISYSAGVTQQNVGGPFESTLSVLGAAGHEATFNFTGRRFGIMVRQTPASGIAELRLDGAFLRNIDLYSATQRERMYIWQQQVTEGPHTLTVRWTGTRNAASTGTAVHVDGIAAITQGGLASIRVQQR